MATAGGDILRARFDDIGAGSFEEVASEVFFAMCRRVR